METTEIKELAEKHLPNKVEEVKEISKGLMHETYSLETSEKDYILQFEGESENAEGNLENNLDAYKFLQNSDVPVPGLITGKINEFEGRPYMIVDKLPGKTIEKNITAERVRESGKMLAKLHKQAGFEHEGWVDLEEQKLYEFDQGSLKQRTFDELEDKLDVFRQEGWEDLVHRIENFFEANRDEFVEDFEPVLCHADFSPDNLLWQDGEVTGVIDFDYVHSSYALRDLTHSANCFWTYDPGADWNIREKFYEGYREVREIEEFEEKERLYRIETLVWLVASMIELEVLDEDEKEFYRKQIIEEISR